MTDQTATRLPLGTQVYVSDFTPRPPDRFRRKLADWKFSNYRGVVVEICKNSGRYTIQLKPEVGWNPNQHFVMLRSGVSPERVRAIPGAVLAPLGSDGGSSRWVRVPELLRAEAEAA